MPKTYKITGNKQKKKYKSMLEALKDCQINLPYKTNAVDLLRKYAGR